MDSDVSDASDVLMGMGKSGSAEVRDVGVVTGKKREIMREVSRFLSCYDKNVCSGYNAGVQVFDCYRYDMHMLRYNETHNDADAVTIISEAAIYKN